MFRYYNHLGFFNPYFIEKDNDYLFSANFPGILNLKDSRNRLDIASIVCMLTKGFVIGDRTLVKDVNKAPFYSRYENGSWDVYQEVKFDSINLDKHVIVERLLNLLKEELVEYIGDKKNVGILLSGGMDSRMIAGILDLLIRDKILENIHVTALTWGDERSRDVVYSKKIAKELGWSWKHYTIGPEDFIKNIRITSENGSEYSPNHLHAMLKVREEKELDCIVAGSYGDSIGRGEYSGKTVLQLLDLRSNISNRYGFLKESLFEKSLSFINDDIDRYWNLFPQKEPYQQIEQDYQIHYMRRLLNPCLSLINEKIPLYQAFTSPEIVQFMWSLNPELRNNDIYKGLLQRFNAKISQIPWARTGLPFGENEGRPDEHLRSYETNIYSNIFRNDIFEHVKELVLSDRMKSLEIFNWNVLSTMFKLIKSPIYRNNLALEEKLTWLASFSLLVEKYDLSADNNFDNDIEYKEKLRYGLIYKEMISYFIKYQYRKFWLKKF